MQPGRAVASLHHGPVGWPVCLQRLAGTDPVSLQSGSVHRAQGCPGRDVSSPCQVNHRMLGQLGNVGRSVNFYAGVPWVSRAMWPNTDKWHLLIKSITGGKPVRADTSALVICCNQCMGRIWHLEFHTWNATNIFCHMKVISSFWSTEIESSKLVK